jgi:hypothetical protein
MLADSAAHVGGPDYRRPVAKAKTSNSIYLLPGVDGRSAIARRFRDLIRGWLDELALTERDLTNTQRLQLRHTALLAVLAALKRIVIALQRAGCRTVGELSRYGRL